MRPSIILGALCAGSLAAPILESEILPTFSSIVARTPSPTPTPIVPPFPPPSPGLVFPPKDAPSDTTSTDTITNSHPLGKKLVADMTAKIREIIEAKGRHRNHRHGHKRPHHRKENDDAAATCAKKSPNDTCKPKHKFSGLKQKIIAQLWRHFHRTLTALRWHRQSLSHPTPVPVLLNGTSSNCSFIVAPNNGSQQAPAVRAPDNSSTAGPAPTVTLTTNASTPAADQIVCSIVASIQSSASAQSSSNAALEQATPALAAVEKNQTTPEIDSPVPEAVEKKNQTTPAIDSPVTHSMKPDPFWRFIYSQLKELKALDDAKPILSKETLDKMCARMQVIREKAASASASASAAAEATSSPAAVEKRFVVDVSDVGIAAQAAKLGIPPDQLRNQRLARTRRTQTHPDATQEEWRQAFPMLMHATTSNVNVVTQDELDAANAKPSKAVA